MGDGRIFPLNSSMKRRRRPRWQIVVRHCQNKGVAMMDIVVLAIGVLFFVLSLAYVKSCDSL